MADSNTARPEKAVTALIVKEGWVLGLATENEDGYNRLNYGPFEKEEQARALADDINKNAFGLTPERALKHVPGDGSGPRGTQEDLAKMSRPAYEYKTPLGAKSSDPSVLQHWNRLADVISSPGWIHQGTDDRYGTLTFRSTQPSVHFLPLHSGGVEILHVEHALWLYERIRGKPFSEDIP